MGLTRGAAALLLLPGCFWVTTKHEGQQLRKDVANLQTRMAKQEESLDQRVKQLDESVDKATKLLARNSADLGADVERLAADLAAMNGVVQDLKRENALLREQLDAQRDACERRLAATETRLAELEKQITAGRPTGPGPTTPQPTASELFDGAGKKMAAGQLADARRDYREFLKRFPTDDRADDAQYYLGELFVREGAHEKAIAEFQKVIDNYPNGDMVDDAFFAAGNAAAELKWCTDARAYFGVLLQKYPQSPHAKKAKERLDHLKKNAKNPKVCQS